MSTGSSDNATLPSRLLSLIFPMLIIGSVLVIVAPLPSILLDVMIACNVTLGVIILLTTIHVQNPLEFSVFPAILLGTTLSRLVLNVASTRLILTGAATEGTDAAGQVIKAFGEFVAGGSPTIGVIIFVILIAIQFLVITKGATRISEVTARFTLDAMPGKQMAIDADLGAGLISQEQAKVRREEIAQQADFYGAMDGASKFVRGDAVASIVITLINIVGGLYVGMVNHSMNFMDAMTVFTTLTIGDGLVTQVPAFLISLAAGLIVTRTSKNSNLPGEMIGQLFRHPVAMFLSAGFLLLLSFTGLPFAPLMTLGVGCAVIGFMQIRGQNQRVEQEAIQEAQASTAPPPPESPSDKLKIDPMELELGAELLQLANPQTGGDLLERVSRTRIQMAEELGLIFPKMRIKDLLSLPKRTYRFKIRGVEVARGELIPNWLLAIETPKVVDKLAPNDTIISTLEPAYQRPAFWIDPAHRTGAERDGYRVIEPSTALIMHLQELVREHADELLTRQQVHELIDHLKDSSPKVVEELIPDIMRPSQVHQVLERLLRERIPIRDLEAILETLGDYGERIKELTLLTEYVRHRLGRTICQKLRDRNNVLRCVSLDPALEDMIASGFDYGESGLVVKLSPHHQKQLVRAVANHLEKLTSIGCLPVVLCSPHIRPGLRQVLMTDLRKTNVISMNEVTRDTSIEVFGQVMLADLHQTANTAA